MAQCPHCKKDGVGYFAKHLSWKGGPAQCRECGGLSYAEKHGSSWGRLIGIMPVVAPVLIILFWSWWTVVGLAAALVALVTAHEISVHRARLIATSSSEAAYSRRWGYGFAGAVAVVIVAAAVIAAMS